MTMNNPIRFGVAGEAGSFSEEAALVYAARECIKVTLVYLLDMEGVLAALEAGLIELGIFPVMNTTGGLVTQAFVAMGRHPFKPLSELWLQVNQCLLVRPGVQQQQIEKIISHSQPLSQCEQYLKKEFAHVEQLTWSDTAQAASDLAQGKLGKNTAVIAPARCAEIYQLIVCAENIQDANPNLTAFIIAQHLVTEANNANT